MSFLSNGLVRDCPCGFLATVMEYKINESLKLEKNDRPLSRRVDRRERLTIAFDMEYFHEKKIVHFDMKCENLLVNTRDPHRPIWKAVVLFATGGYGTYLGFRIRFSSNVEEKAIVKDLHPKLLAGMFFFFALGATGGVRASQWCSRYPHAVSGFIGLALLTLQTILPTLFEADLRNVDAIIGSGSG